MLKVVAWKKKSILIELVSVQVSLSLERLECMLLRKSPKFLKLPNFTFIGCDVCGRHSKCYSEFPPWQVSERPCQSSLVPGQSYRHSDHQQVRKRAVVHGTPLCAHVPIAPDRGYSSTSYQKSQNLAWMLLFNHSSAYVSTSEWHCTASIPYPSGVEFYWTAWV